LPDPLELRLSPDDDRLPPEPERVAEEPLELERELTLPPFDDFFDLSPLDFRVPSALRSLVERVEPLLLLSTCFDSPPERLLFSFPLDRLPPVDFLTALLSGWLGWSGVLRSSDRRTVPPERPPASLERWTESLDFSVPCTISFLVVVAGSLRADAPDGLLTSFCRLSVLR
jgi:hypothetical protein